MIWLGATLTATSGSSDVPVDVPGVTVNRLCGSSVEATGTAARAIKSSIIGVRHDLSDKVSPSFFSHGSSWPAYPATSFPASRSTLFCAGITAKPSLRLSRITYSSAIAWSKPHSASVWVCTPNPLYEALGPDTDSCRQAYRRLFRVAMKAADLKAIRDSLHQGWALGDDRFREGIARLSERRPAPLRKGRPRKNK